MASILGKGLLPSTEISYGIEAQGNSKEHFNGLSTIP